MSVESIFYTLPARYVMPGMSTDDGQTIIGVESWPGTDPAVLIDKYTPRPDDADADESNREQSSVRMARPDERVSLAVFADTEVDGSRHPDAIIVRTVDVGTED